MTEIPIKSNKNPNYTTLAPNFIICSSSLTRGFCFVGALPQLRARCHPTALLPPKSQCQPWFPPSVAVSVDFFITACRKGQRRGLNHSFAVGFVVFHRWPPNPHRRPIASLPNSVPPLRRCSELVKSAESGDSSTSVDRICKCGLIAQLKVSNSEANPGMEYYSCPNGRCRWFRWEGPSVKCPVRVGGQNRERDAEESQVGLGSSLLVHERIRKIENDCVTLKILACMNLLCFVFCLFLLMMLLFKH
ncbi:hypothetical protein PIB30_057262 [Stylosanthes scabra]|uniref:GRF-type domain-containing protein n=1 Tax=Stylosanthes scabra TaxID=79078 RepID=A0ABU6XI99_9FABA|nr:hypothetical protein [Stylosanthes scabra]